MKTLNPSLKTNLSSFFLPFIITGTAFALHGVYPFGDNQILTLDLYYQHYPFLSHFWHNIREANFSPWSWTGGGHDYTSLFAYFLSSPLNFLTVLFPYYLLREVLTFIVLVKIGCAGLFTFMFLRYTFKKSGYELLLFSLLYALCAFTLGYYYSINSFDNFALLPLVVMGLLAMMKEGRWNQLYRCRLYILSLALAVLANFYYSFFIFLFAAIAFFSYCIINKLKRREFFRKLGLMAACSALAVGMAGVILLPTIDVLGYVYSGGNFPTEPTLYHSFIDVLGNFIAFTPPTVLFGLPNLYSGLISVLLVGPYFFSKTISRREKIVVLVILAFLLLSCNLNVLDYIMHGFRFPNAVPSRFSFLISFVLVLIAYRGYVLTESIEKRSLFAMGISALVFLLAAVFGSQELNAIIGSAVLCIIYLLALFFYFRNRTKKTKQAAMTVFFLMVIMELSVGSWIGVNTAKTTERDKYTASYDQIQYLLGMRNLDIPMQTNSTAKANVDFYRTEIPFQNYNAPFLYNYNGISLFSSTINADVTGFMRGLGISGGGMGTDYFYVDTSPLTNAFLNLRYLIFKRSFLSENIFDYWETAGETNSSLLLKNKYYLPLGFMVKEDMTSYEHEENLFITQNNLFRLATGLKGDLFTITKLEFSEITSLDNSELNDVYIYKTIIPSNGMYYIFPISNKNYIHSGERTISPVGFREQDEIADFYMPGMADILIGCLDSELFKQGYSLLAKQPLILTKFTNTQVCGNVTALEDGLLYTSIPADKNWSIYVDGIKSEIVLIDNAMTAVRLNKGTHQIEFRYFNTSLLIGIAISLVSLAVFIALVLRKKGSGIHDYLLPSSQAGGDRGTVQESYAK